MRFTADLIDRSYEPNVCLDIDRLEIRGAAADLGQNACREVDRLGAVQHSQCIVGRLSRRLRQRYPRRCHCWSERRRSSVPDPPFRLANFEYVKIELSTPALVPVNCQLSGAIGADQRIRAAAAFERHGYRASRQLNGRRHQTGDLRAAGSIRRESDCFISGISRIIKDDGQHRNRRSARHDGDRTVNALERATVAQRNRTAIALVNFQRPVSAQYT